MKEDEDQTQDVVEFFSAQYHSPLEQLLIDADNSGLDTENAWLAYLRMLKIIREIRH